MQQLKINFILPVPSTKPGGGTKIMYEYANRLSDKGHIVNIYHSIKRPFKKSNTPLLFKRAMYALRGVARPKWFKLNDSIGSYIVPEITDKYLPDADIVMCTWWQMAYAINELSPSKGAKFNFIQDYEIWTGRIEQVHKSYSLPLHHIVIAKYLQELLFEKTHVLPTHIPNAIDLNKFNLQVAIKERFPQSVIMLYSEEPRKATPIGLQALQMVNNRYPSLRVELFGVYPPPANLPPNFHYVQKPNNLCELYNNAAIFITPSLGEGWALPPAEAMACGCAVVCTDIGGHRDYAADGETALLVPVEDPKTLSEKIFRLIEDPKLRLTLATNGNKMIRSEFSWEASVKKMEACFLASQKELPNQLHKGSGI